MQTTAVPEHLIPVRAAKYYSFEYILPRISAYWTVLVQLRHLALHKSTTADSPYSPLCRHIGDVVHRNSPQRLYLWYNITVFILYLISLVWSVVQAQWMEITCCVAYE